MSAVKRVMLTVAYDGTNYCGFQVQPNGLAVQQVLNEALSRLTKEDIRTIGASRTDAGVHARGNVCVFDTEARMPGEKYAYALNTMLPEDIKIQGSREVPAAFHPRYTETIKTYEYDILHRRFPDPTRRLHALFCYRPLNVAAMQKAADCLVGTHDFRSFQASGETNPEKDTVRTIYAAELTDADELLRFRITGNGFLYNMVRIVTGTLLDIGEGRIPASRMTDIIEARNRAAAGQTAPAKGLTLLDIRYPAWEPWSEL